jgi:hypothetical protein
MRGRRRGGDLGLGTGTVHVAGVHAIPRCVAVVWVLRVLLCASFFSERGVIAFGFRSELLHLELELELYAHKPSWRSTFAHWGVSVPFLPTRLSRDGLW